MGGLASDLVISKNYTSSILNESAILPSLFVCLCPKMFLNDASCDSLIILCLFKFYWECEDFLSLNLVAEGLISWLPGLCSAWSTASD